MLSHRFKSQSHEQVEGLLPNTLDYSAVSSHIVVHIHFVPCGQRLPRLAVLTCCNVCTAAAATDGPHFLASQSFVSLFYIQSQ